MPAAESGIEKGRVAFPTNRDISGQVHLAHAFALIGVR
jgi:hypothetical protein